MAKVNNMFKLSGTLGGLTFKQTPNGTIVSVKSSLDGKRIKTDPRFRRTRENCKEFGYTAKLAAALVRTIHSCWEGKIAGAHCRLVKLILPAVKQDPTNAPGERILVPAYLRTLVGFDFNKELPLAGTLMAGYTIFKSRPKGKFILQPNPFMPVHAINAPEAASHYRIIFAVLALNLQTLEMTTADTRSECLPLYDGKVDELSLEAELPGAEGKSLLFAMGIEFVKLENGRVYPLKSKGSGAVAIIDIDA